MMRIAHISMKLVIGVAVLERVRRVGVEEPAAVRAELLDGDLAGHRAAGDRLRDLGRDGGVDRRRLGEAAEVLHHAAERQQRWRRRTTAAAGCAASCGSRSTQKLPSVRRPRRTMPRMIATTTAMPAAADTKFCTAKPDHLGEVAHRHLAAVPLPVRVGHEADRGVERTERGDGGHVRRVERAGCPGTAAARTRRGTRPG